MAGHTSAPDAAVANRTRIRIVTWNGVGNKPTAGDRIAGVVGAEVVVVTDDGIITGPALAFLTVVAHRAGIAVGA